MELTVQTRDCLCKYGRVRAPLTCSWMLSKIVFAGEITLLDSNPDLESAGGRMQVPYLSEFPEQTSDSKKYYTYLVM